MIKNIIFDLADVIMGSYFGIDYILEKEYNIPSKDFLSRDKQTIDYFFDTMRGKHSEDEYMSYLLEGTNWNITAEKLKKILSKQGFMLLRIDPYIPLTIRDSDGNIMNFNNKGNQIIESLKKAGFNYKGKT